MSHQEEHHRHYQTIDPLIMETLQLNEKRLAHIFDILHGKDPGEGNYSHIYSPKKSALIDSKTTKKGPYVKKTRDKSPSLKVMKSPEISKFQESLNRSRDSISINQKKSLTSKKKQHHSQIVSLPKPIFSHREQVLHDYGHREEKPKAKEINPKDLYRMQTQKMVSKLTEIPDLEKEQKQMKRIKRKYKHLQRFDQHYYSNLNKNDLLLI